ncbi:MAG: 2-oxoacid:ferredoxin oxidoreductase subunit beta, partial [Myxococcota bacterium]
AIDIEQHDGSVLRLRKLSTVYDPGDRIAAMNYIHEHQARGEVVTGLLFVDRKARDLHQHMNTVAVPFNTMAADELCPGAETLEKVNASLR